jgi:hypothetical protein
LASRVCVLSLIGGSGCSGDSSSAVDAGLVLVPFFFRHVTVLDTLLLEPPHDVLPLSLSLCQRDTRLLVGEAVGDAPSQEETVSTVVSFSSRFITIMFFFFAAAAAVAARAAAGTAGATGAAAWARRISWLGNWPVLAQVVLVLVLLLLLPRLLDATAALFAARCLSCCDPNSSVAPLITPLGIVVAAGRPALVPSAVNGFFY